MTDRPVSTSHSSCRSMAQGRHRNGMGSFDQWLMGMAHRGPLGVTMERPCFRASSPEMAASIVVVPLRTTSMARTSKRTGFHSRLRSKT